jgi:hypothetical protein
VAVFRHLNRSSKNEIACLGFVGLVLQGEAATLDQIERYLPRIKQAGLMYELVRSVAMRVDASDGNVAALGRIATSQVLPPELPVAAAQALRNIHTADTVPHFIYMLDSRDPQVRQHALAGLSFFVRNFGLMTRESGPSMAWAKPLGPTPYRTPETDKFNGFVKPVPIADHPVYVAFWKSWWVKVRDELMKK